MPKRLLILIVPTAAAFLLLLGVITVDFIRARTGAMPGEAPGLGTYLATAGGRIEPSPGNTLKVAAIGVTPPAGTKRPPLPPPRPPPPRPRR